MDPVTNDAAPAQPAPTAPVAPIVETPEATPLTARKPLGELSEAERLEWRKTGTRPAAEPVAPEATDEADLAAATAPPVAGKPLSARQQKINDRIREATAAATRELQAEVNRLRAAQSPAPPVDRPRFPTGPAQPAPATTVADLIARPNIAAAPITEAEFFQKFPDAAYHDYPRYLARYDLALDRVRDQQERQQAHAAQSFHQQATSFAERVTAARQKDPQFDTKVGPVVTVLGPGTPIGDAIFASEAAPELLLHFAAHPDDFQRIARLPAHLQLKEMGRLEAKFDPAAPGAADRSSASVAAGSLGITQTPEPPPTLGSRPGEPLDPIRAALKRRDTGSYITLANKRDLAARGR